MFTRRETYGFWRVRRSPLAAAVALRMQNGSFLSDVMVDESTEKKSDIRRGMLVPVCFFDSATDRSVTRLLDLRKVHTEARHSLHAF